MKKGYIIVGACTRDPMRVKGGVLAYTSQRGRGVTPTSLAEATLFRTIEEAIYALRVDATKDPERSTRFDLMRVEAETTYEASEIS